MKWFKRHLNWVALLSWVAVYPLSYAIGALILSISPYMSTGAYYAIAYLIIAVWLFGISGWVLRKKNRGLWHLLWLVIPFGWIVFLSLENKSGEITSGEESTEEVPWEVFSKMPSNRQTSKWTSEKRETLKHVVGKCPYCESTSTSQSLVGESLSKEKMMTRGYQYKWDCKCSECGKEWFGVE